jgi:NTP pyrophosphatase (non-canonical NTP hydrolase)
MKKLEADILQYLKDRKWDELRPGDIAKSIVIEGAELLEHFQWENRELTDVRSDIKKRKEISEELADVLIYTLELSILLGLDTEAIIRAKLKKIEKKYPAKRMAKAKQAGDSSEYWSIKQKRRAKKKHL